MANNEIIHKNKGKDLRGKIFGRKEKGKRKKHK